MSGRTVREVVDIDAPARQVWDHVVDWGRQGDWIPGTRVRTIGAGAGVGARIEAWTGLGGLGVTDTMTITAWDPPHRCEVLHTGRLVRGEGGFVVVPKGIDRARFEWWECLVLPAGPVGSLAWRALGPAVRLTVRRSLGTLKHLVES